MVKSPEFLKAVKDWVREHPRTACRGDDRRGLEKLYVSVCEKEEGKSISLKEAENPVKQALRKARGVVISPKYTNKGNA